METETVKSREKNRESGIEKRMKNLKPFQKGKSGNPAGLKAGTRNYKTIEREAIIMIAKENNMTEQELENMLVASGIKRALKGDYRYYKDAMDRRHGQAVKSIDVTSGGKTMGELLDELEEEDK